jgi:hypothetical protein
MSRVFRYRPYILVHQSGCTVIKISYCYLILYLHINKILVQDASHTSLTNDIHGFLGSLLDQSDSGLNLNVECEHSPLAK